MGKSTLLFNLVVTSMLDGDGICVLDPHGDLVEQLLDTVPPWRTEDCSYLTVSDPVIQSSQSKIEIQESGYLVGFNPLARVREEHHATAAAGMLSAFKNIWGGPDGVGWGARLEWQLLNALHVLLARPKSTFYDLPRLFFDEPFRESSLTHVTNPQVLRFWLEERPSYSDQDRRDAISPILNKIGQLLIHPTLRGILCQEHPKLDIPSAIEEKKIILVNLSRGIVGDEPSHLLGSLVVSAINHAGKARAAKRPEERTLFHLVCDEFQSFGTSVFEEILSGSRKYGIALTLGHQFTDQLRKMVRAGVLGNAGTMFVFAVGPEDAELLAPKFHPLPPHELISQLPYRAWVDRSKFLAHFPVDLEPARRREDVERGLR